MPKRACLALQEEPESHRTPGTFIEGPASSVGQEGMGDDAFFRSVVHIPQIEYRTQLDRSISAFDEVKSEIKQSNFDLYGNVLSDHIHQKHDPISRMLFFDPITGDLTIKNGKASIILKQNGDLILSGISVKQIADKGLHLSAAYIDLN